MKARPAPIIHSIPGLIAILIVSIVGATGCDSSGAVVFDGCAKNIRHYMSKDEVERMCGKPARTAKAGPVDVWIYVKPGSKKELHIQFTDKGLHSGIFKE
jgi:hypothetical protein